MDARNMLPWDHPLAADKATKSKAAAFITALGEARSYAAGGPLPDFMSAPPPNSGGGGGEGDEGDEGGAQQAKAAAPAVRKHGKVGRASLC
jgi:hypothetical protein